MAEAAEERRRPLIVVIDEDDDIGSTLGTSVVKGYENVLKAGIEFATARPEDADSNSIFVGLNLYKRFKEEGRDPEIVIVGGHPKSGLLAQDLIKKRVKEVIGASKGNYELYIVSDGLDELLMAEVLRDVGPIAGVKRVVVEQSLGVEESYVLLARYIRKALNDPRYSKYFLGVPGVLLLVFGVLTIFGYLLLSLKIIAALLGLFMILKGFNVEEAAWRAAKSVAVRLKESSPLQLAGLGILAVTVLASSYSVYFTARSSAPLPVKVGVIISVDLTVVMIGVTMYILVSEVFFKLSRRDFSLWREAEVLVTLIMMAVAFYFLGGAISSTQFPSAITSSYVYQVVIGSGFLFYAVLGAASASLIEIARRVKEHVG
ncbi:MAG: DUF373 family protein [Acidilobus sp.]